MQIFLDQWDHVCLSALSTASKIERISNFVFQLADKPRVKTSLASYFPHRIDRDSNDPDTAGPIRPLWSEQAIPSYARCATVSLDE